MDSNVFAREIDSKAFKSNKVLLEIQGSPMVSPRACHDFWVAKAKEHKGNKRFQFIPWPESAKHNI